MCGPGRTSVQKSKARVTTGRWRRGAALRLQGGRLTVQVWGGGGSDLGARDEPRGSVSRRLKLVCEGAWGGGVGGRRKQMLAIFLYFAWF